MQEDVKVWLEDMEKAILSVYFKYKVIHTIL